MRCGCSAWTRDTRNHARRRPRNRCRHRQDGATVTDTITATSTPTNAEPVPGVDYSLFDADNHYYEATDAYTRHISPTMAKRAMQWAEVDGRLRLLVGGRVN